jgi:uncharacterized membrane protein
MHRKFFAAVIALILAALLAPASFAQRRLGPKARATITIGSGAAIGAGVGGLFRGKKGAAIGALLGGGGTTAVYLLRNRNYYYAPQRSYYAPGRSYYGQRRVRRCR